MKRLDAETLRARWLAGVDAPPQDVAGRHLARGGRALRGLRARLRAGPRAHDPAPGSCARPATWPAPASWATWPARPRTALGAQPLLDELRAIGGAPVRAESAPDTLTPRESEILTLVAEGRSNGEIAKQLFISAKTVSVHVSNILGKLDASGRTEAAAIARRRGLIA